ncbi:MAG: hypothetical protein NTW32_01365 [Chloroflexi bacterium]|nr:hypothetical protein [Chloroflexota bacterium]
MKRPAHKTALLFTAILIVLMALPISALADGGAGGNEFTQTVNGYQVTLSFDKPAFVGENDIHVLVKDGMGMRVPQADLEVSVAEAGAEHVESAPVAEAGTMTGMSPEPSTEADTMSGMGSMDAAQPTPETGTMSGMGSTDAQPTAEIGTMTAVTAMDDQMSMTVLTAGHESGEYDGQLAIESDGDQTVLVHMTIAGKLTQVEFPLHVAKSKTGAIVLGSFFTLDFALISAAVVMKRKSGSATLSKKA